MCSCCVWTRMCIPSALLSSRPISHEGRRRIQSPGLWSVMRVRACLCTACLHSPGMDFRMRVAAARVIIPRECVCICCAVISAPSGVRMSPYTRTPASAWSRAVRSSARELRVRCPTCACALNARGCAFASEGRQRGRVYWCCPATVMEPLTDVTHSLTVCLLAGPAVLHQLSPDKWRVCSFGSCTSRRASVLHIDASSMALASPRSPPSAAVRSRQARGGVSGIGVASACLRVRSVRAMIFLIARSRWPGVSCLMSASRASTATIATMVSLVCWCVRLREAPWPLACAVVASLRCRTRTASRSASAHVVCTTVRAPMPPASTWA